MALATRPHVPRRTTAILPTTPPSAWKSATLQPRLTVLPVRTTLSGSVIGLVNDAPLATFDESVPAGSLPAAGNPILANGTVDGVSAAATETARFADPGEPVMYLRSPLLPAEVTTA